jgi:ABC-2 type transport system ATP-binding protein
MLKLVRHLSRDLGKSVVLSTHILQDVEATCDAVVVLEQGRVVAQGALADLTRSERNEFWFAVDPPGVQLSADGLGIELENRGGGRWRALVPADRSAADLFRMVESKGADVRSLALHRRSLEEVFLGAVGAQAVEPRS